VDLNDPTRTAIARTIPNFAASGEHRRLEIDSRAHASLSEGCVLVNGRIQIEHQLGSGGMGVVYRAFDRNRRCHVALKTLNRLDPSGIYQLKNEFRALCDVRHPNLVGLHEFFTEPGGRWFFTMDLIHGKRFDWAVRPTGELDAARLRPALLQLIDALDAIHESGKLHRDVKPSNVLVTPEGRLVVLDFGLVVVPELGTVGQTLPELAITGTPAYMAPEQATGQPSSRASDLYAVGVMLYEALTGQCPFVGSAGEILAAKQRDTPRRPLDKDAPRELVDLCLALLARDPAVRPDSRAIRAAIGGDTARTSWQVRPTNPPAMRTELIGRESELRQLRDAYHEARDGSPVVISIAGESGIGKTALLSAFLDEVRTEPAVVLSGRCYEHENVPFKLLDPLIDDLSRHLRRLPPERAAALLPRDAFALGQLFPVLMRVPSFAEAPWRKVPEPRELQRLAFGAFSELLCRIRDRQPLVVCIDDLQWTDADSAQFVRHLLVGREIPAALFVVSHRCIDAAQQSPPLQLIVEAVVTNGRLDVREIKLTPLPPDDTTALAARTLGNDARDTHGLSAAISAESHGNPFFAIELARFAQADPNQRHVPSLTEVIAARAAALSPPARALLQALALAGQPLEISVLLRAGYSYSDIDALSEYQLVRSPDARENKLLECYHDRVRESVEQSASPAERAARYAELAGALGDDSEPELLSRCLEGAGDYSEAARHAARAAARAAEALAFDRAADLYRRALSLGRFERSDRIPLLQQLGQALENAGRCLEAANAYLEAASFAATHVRIDLQLKASEQLMVSGRFEQGMTLLRTVFEDQRLSLPANAGGALVALGWSQIKLRLHSVGKLCARLDERNSLPPQAALRLRTLRSAVTGLAGYLPVQTAAIAASYLLEASACPDPAERVRAAGYYIHTQCAIDPQSRLAHAFLRELDELIAMQPRPELVGFAELLHGTVAMAREEHRTARGHFDRARKALREGTGVEWELDATNVCDQMCAHSCGDYADIIRTTPMLLDEAQRRNRVWTFAMLSSFPGMPAWLATGDADGYRSRAREARKQWRSRPAPAWPDYFLLVSEALLSVYEGDPDRGSNQLETQYAIYRRSLIARTTYTGVTGYSNHRGTCAASALARTNPGAKREALAATLRDSIATLQRHGGPKSHAVAAMYEAALEFNAGSRERGLQRLRSTLAPLRAAGVEMRYAAAQRRLGGCLGGDEGAEYRAAGEAFMREQGVVELEGMTELNCPGFGRA
jgi:serine/threonine protein kinase